MTCAPAMMKILTARAARDRAMVHQCWNDKQFVVPVQLTVCVGMCSAKGEVLSLFA